jgi:DNA polymerase III subunit alpha
MSDTSRKTSSIPFVNLHTHDGIGSPFDGFGQPSQHLEFAYQNGMDSFATTNHGNMNSLVYYLEHAKQMKSEGRDIKTIFGCEMYFIPSHKKWRKEYADWKETQKKVKKENYGIVVEDEDRQKKRNPLKSRAHLVVLAQNQTGLNNLFKLVSDSYKQENFYRFPRVDFDMLAKHSEGLIVSTACMSGIVARAYYDNRDKTSDHIIEAVRHVLAQFVDIFGDRFYGELQWNAIPDQHIINNYVIQACTEMGIELISTADSHYPEPDMWKDREMYKRIGWAGKAPEWAENPNMLPENTDEIGYELYPKNGDEMWAAYKKYSAKCGVEYDDYLVRASIERTHYIATELIEDFQPDTTVRLPDFVVPEGKTAIQALTEDCIRGLKEKNLHRNKEYVDRLKYELDVIKERDFAKYFLTMKAISDKAWETQLCGTARGSAAGALMSYVLGITQVDPIKYHLQFERFLSKYSSGMPDIDFDCSERKVLVDSLTEMWGEDSVVSITNVNTLQLRSLIKDISKFYDVPFAEVNNVTGKMLIEATPKAKKAHGITAGVYAPTYDEVKKYSESLQGYFKKHPSIATHVENILGNPRGLSTHAGGAIISENISSHMPLINFQGKRQTPWAEGQNVRHLEPMGFIKFDLLGLSTLRMIQGAIEHILRRHKNIENPTFDQVKDYYNTHLNPETIDFGDQHVWENVFHKGNFVGTFQFTQKGVQQFCTAARPSSIEELSNITAIYRPGPLAAKVHDQYLMWKEDPDTVEYVHPLEQEILKDTGFLIFQEQLAMLAHKLGKDISLDEGNLLRKVLTKRGTGKGGKAEEIKKKFVAGCLEKGITERQADDMWRKFIYFNAYAFNASHSCSYAIISYQCAWLSTYYEAEWAAAFLDKEPEKRKAAAINIAKKLGFSIAPPSINNSGRVWEISKDGKTLIQPLGGIKGLGDAAIDQIIAHRPFETVEDFLFHKEIVYSKLNKKAVDVLVRSQALNDLMDLRFTGLNHYWSAIAVDRPKSKKKLLENIETYAAEGDFSNEEKIEHFASLTGIFPVDAVMSEELQEKLYTHACPPISEFDPELKVCWFIPREVIRRKTKNGKEYWILKVIDINGADEDIKCWGVRESDRLHLNKVYMGKLKFEDKWGFSTFGVSKNLKRLT